MSRPGSSLRRDILVVALCSGVANLLLLTPTVYMLQVYDRVLVSGSELTLLAVSLLALMLLAAVAMSEAIRSRLLVALGTRMEREIGGRVFRGSFEAAAGGDPARAAQAFPDLAQVRQFATGAGIFAFFDAPWVPVYVAVTFLLHPWLGLLALVFACVQVMLAWAGQQPSARRGAEAAASAAQARAALAEKLQGAETVHALGMLGTLRRRWQQGQDGVRAEQARAQDQHLRLASISKFVRYTQQSLALAAGALLVIRGDLTPGAMIAANVLIARALAPLDMVVSQWRSLAEARAAWQRLRQLLAAGEAAVAAGDGPAAEVRGALRLQGVCAHAPEDGAAILQDMSLDIAAGQTVVVLGPSGSGKSTLARCLVGAWRDVRGELLLDGAPLASRSRAAVGPRIGYLPQDVQLFEGTVAENIARMGVPDPAKVVAAARAVGLHDTILRLPAGYDTPVGPGGGLLSGGQRQRVALARALYGDPSLLVLDEPNASLDQAGESALAETLLQLRRQGRTIVLVAQRLSSLQFADRVLVLRGGKVAAWGPPSSVLAAAG